MSTTSAATDVPADIAVVGGAGFLGRRLVRHLAAAGHRAHVLDLPAGIGEQGVPDAASVQAVSTGDADLLIGAVEQVRPDLVIDLAYLVGPPAEEDVDLASRVNLLGPLNTARAAHLVGARRYVQASSIAVYGPSSRSWGRAVTEDDMLPLDRHATTYGAFKCVNEFQLRRLEAETGLSATSVRLSIVLGPARGNGLATWPSRFLTSLGAGVRRHHLPVPSAARASLLCADDAVELLVLAALHPDPRPVYNSGGHDLSARDLVGLARRLRPDVEVEYDDGAPNIPFVNAVDNARARHDLGFALRSAAHTVQAVVDS